MLQALEAAFEDNESPAAAVNAEGARVSLVMLFDTTEVIPERKPGFTPTGRPTLQKRTKSEINDLYAQALASQVLATVKEAFAVVPGIEEASLLVVRKDPRVEKASDFVSAIYAGTFSRSRLQRLNWGSLDPIEELLLVPDALLRRKGAAGEIAPLDLSNEPELRQVVDEVRRGLATGESSVSLPVG